jgi:DNA-binding GntR family transcriptional regulator
MRSVGHVIEAALRASFLLSAPVATEDRETVLLWHQRFVDGIAQGDAEMASTAMVEVIHNGMRRHERSPDVQDTDKAVSNLQTRNGP